MTLKRALLLLIAALSAFGQGQNTVVTGTTDASALRWIAPSGVYASRPSGASTNMVYIVTDDASVGACTGGGSSATSCRWNGSAWVALGDGGGGSSGTVTTTGTMTTSAIVASNGTTVIKTPSATATIDSSGNISTPGSISSGVGGSVAGYSGLGSGTATAAATGQVGWMAPTSVTTPYFMRPPGAPTTGFFLNTGTTDPTTVTFVPSNGSGNVLLSAGTAAIASGKTLTVSNSVTFAGTDSTVMTFPSTNATIARTDAANTFTGTQTMTVAAASASTATTQSAADNSTKLATTAYVDTAISSLKLQCEMAWGGSGTSFALASGDDAVANNSCFNKTGKTWTITAVYCKSDAGSNTTTVHPTFGAAGTGTTILSGALTCGSSEAYSSTGTVSNPTLADGNGIRPVMGGTLTGTNIHLLVVYTRPF